MIPPRFFINKPFLLTSIITSILFQNIETVLECHMQNIFSQLRPVLLIIETGNQLLKIKFWISKVMLYWIKSDLQVQKDTNEINRSTVVSENALIMKHKNVRQLRISLRHRQDNSGQELPLHILTEFRLLCIFRIQTLTWVLLKNVIWVLVTLNRSSLTNRQVLVGCPRDLTRG